VVQRQVTRRSMRKVDGPRGSYGVGYRRPSDRAHEPETDLNPRTIHLAEPPEADYGS